MCYKDDLILLRGWLRANETVRNTSVVNTNSNRARNERRRSIIQWARHWRRRNLAAYRRFQNEATGMCMAG